jgi:hypothetical protein
MLMSQFANISGIALGLIIAIAAPFLSNVRLYLPPPRTKFGRRAAVVANEALACVFLLGGITGLLGATAFSAMLHDVQVIVMIVFVMVFLGAMFIDGVIFREETENKRPGES